MVARFAVALVLWRELQYDFAFRRTGLAVVISLSGRLKAKKREDLKDVRMRERWQLLKRSKRLGDLKSWIVFFFLCVCVFMRAGGCSYLLPWPGHDLAAVIDVTVAGATPRGRKFFTNWSW